MIIKSINEKKRQKREYDKCGIFCLGINDRKIFYYKLINIIKYHLQIKYPLRNRWLNDKYIILKNPQIIASNFCFLLIDCILFFGNS